MLRAYPFHFIYCLKSKVIQAVRMAVETLPSEDRYQILVSLYVLMHARFQRHGIHVDGQVKSELHE